MQLIQIKEVVKEFNKQAILQDISLAVDEGELLGIIGESGSGKTTLLQVMAGFLRPTRGEVLYQSKVTRHAEDLHKNIRRLKKYIGFTPQHNSFYPELTVLENLLHFGTLYGMKRKILVNNIRGLLHVTNLVEHREKLAGELSGGMQRRLDISCSMVHKPKLLILDEPTTDLDLLLQKDIFSLLKSMHKQGVTIILASHNIKCIEQTCTKVAVLHAGKLFNVGDVEKVRKSFSKNNKENNEEKQSPTLTEIFEKVIAR